MSPLSEVPKLFPNSTSVLCSDSVMQTKYDWYKEASPRARALMFVVDVFKVVLCENDVLTA